MIRYLLLTLCFFTMTTRPNAAEFTYYKDLDDNRLDKEIRAGNVQAMQEGRVRQSPTFKQSLEWVAEHYTVAVLPIGQSCVGKKCTPRYPPDYARELQDSQLLERLTRNNAKVELVRWGEKKYFDEFAIRLSTSDLKVQVETMRCLQRIDNMAALKYLAPILDSKAVIPRSGDVYSQSIALYAAGTMDDIAISNLGIPEPDMGPDYEAEKFRLYWKQWWHDNKEKYGDIPFENGWLKKIKQQ